MYEGLASIGDDKAPGIDGFNAHFFKKSWPIVKSEIYFAVSEFFANGIMFKGINCTALTLLPKIANPSTVKDFRPIACCTVLYKLIAKILASRLREVLPSIIYETQAGFIPGRK